MLNYEEGAENSVLHGDSHSESFLSEIIGAKPIKGRHINMESFMNLDQKEVFGDYMSCFKKKNSNYNFWSGNGFREKPRCM